MRRYLLFVFFIFTVTISAQTIRNVPAQHPTIQSAIDASTSGDTIIVYNGTYYENIDFKGKALTIRSLHGADSSVIDGGHNGSCVKFISGEISTSVLDGFTITNGAATYGGGIFISGANPTIINSIITGNSVSGTMTGGGGIAIDNASPTIIKCVIVGNSVSAIGTGIGGGIWIGNVSDPNSSTSNPTINNSTIEANSSFSSGGGIYIAFHAAANINSSTINGNIAGGAGGGLYMCDGVSITNSIIINNNCGSWGGGVFAYGGTIINSTIVANTAGSSGGGIDNSMTLTNSIVWDNTAPTNPEVGRGPFGNAPINISYSNIKGGYVSTGNIDANPLFVNATTGDYHLQTGSPCIDTGNNEAVPSFVTTDFDGNNRIIDGNDDKLPNVDMGAYESSAIATVVEDKVRNNPSSYSLNQNYPNPFNPSTKIEFSIPQSSHITLKVYDVLGKEITILINGLSTAGTHTATWNAQNRPSGVYFYRLTAGSYTLTKKLVLMR